MTNQPGYHIMENPYKLRVIDIWCFLLVSSGKDEKMISSSTIVIAMTSSENPVCSDFTSFVPIDWERQ